MALIVAAAIIRDGLLLAARRSGGTFAGLWEFPGGKVEPGEDDHAALHRELREELGVSIAIGQRIGGDWPLDGGHIMHVYFATLDPCQEPRCLEGCDAVTWSSGADTAGLSWIPADLPIVAAVVALIDGRASGHA